MGMFGRILTLTLCSIIILISAKGSVLTEDKHLRLGFNTISVLGILTLYNLSRIGII